MLGGRRERRRIRVLSIGGKGGSVEREGWEGWMLGDVKGLGR